MTDIRSMYYEELEEVVASYGEKPYRAAQLFAWLHEKGASSYEEMTSLPLTLREKLASAYPILTVTPVKTQVSALDGTKKYLFALSDGCLIESVLMHYRFGVSICISSQAGCAMGCTFCASTVQGLDRNLLASEMLGQIYAAGRDAGERIARVVVMGSGEPLHNADALLRMITLLTDARGLHMGMRHITVSTCGIVPEIKRLSARHLQINLAVSLHAATQEKREQLMPVAKTYPLPELMAVCRDYFTATGRQITYEYALMAGVNDTDEDVQALASLLQGQNCTVNLIPVNPVRERGYSGPDKTRVREFQKKLEKMGINGTIRREMGRDIDGACGQLRLRHYEGELTC